MIVHSGVLVLQLEWVRHECRGSRRTYIASNLVASFENIVQVASMLLVDCQLHALLHDEATEWCTDLLLQVTGQLFQGLHHSCRSIVVPLAVHDYLRFQLGLEQERLPEIVHHATQMASKHSPVRDRRATSLPGHVLSANFRFGLLAKVHHQLMQLRRRQKAYLRPLIGKIRD